MNPYSPSASLLPQAWQCYRYGDLARAQQLCQQALAADRDQAEVLNLLGTMAYETGNLDMAIAHMGRAAQVDPTSADFRNNLGVFYTSAGHLPQAVASYQQALALRPAFAEAYNNLSYVFHELGRFDDALACAREALRLRPIYAQANNHLGLALLDLGRPEEAADEFRMALRLQPDLIGAYRNLGTALEEQGQIAEALACYEHALKLAPACAEAHSDMAEALKKLARFEEAVVHLREALRIKPDYAFAWWNLSHFAAQGLCRFSNQEFGSVQALLGSDQISLLDRSLLHLTLANVLDHHGAPDAAFLHYQGGNALRKEWLRETGHAFDAARHHTLVSNTIATFDEAFFRPERPRGSESELPVFVVGMPRSGTSLVEQILASHSQVTGAGELRDIAQLTTTLNRNGQLGGGYPANLRHLDVADLRSLAHSYLGHLAKIAGPAAVRVIDKMPDNLLYLGVIALAFPRARVIHCRRDPLDVCLSCYVQNFKEVGYAWSLEDLGLYYREYERLMAHWQRVLPLPVMEVRYEDLVAHQEAVSRKLVAFCGLEWEESCLAFHKNPRPVQTHSAIQVRRPLYTDSVGRWKKYAAHLEPLRQILGIGSPAAGGLAQSTSPVPSLAPKGHS